MGSSGSSIEKPKIEKTTVFLSKHEEVYRIPALVFDSKEKTLLAFAEKRKSEKDATSMALVMKTGNLNREENSVKWSESKEIMTKKDLKGKRPMNPCPIYAKKSHTLYLFLIGVEGIIPEAGQIFWGINKAFLFFISTKDGGKTWNDITELTDNLSQVKNWATFAVGPGHGVQTETGRLIVPAYAYPSCCSCCEGGRRCLATLFCWCGPFGCTNYCCPPPHALIIYSDNDKKSLKNGKMLEETSLECEIAEMSDGQGKRLIYCNARSWGGLRVEAVAKDCEDSFTKVTSKLVETATGCQGSVVSFPAQPEESGLNPAPLWLLYSHPTSQSKRADLGIYRHKSSQDPGEWSKPWVINSGPSGYSDLAYMEDGLFACLMECGEKSEIEQIAFLFFTYDDVQQGISKERSTTLNSSYCPLFTLNIFLDARIETTILQ